MEKGNFIVMGNTVRDTQAQTSGRIGDHVFPAGVGLVTSHRQLHARKRDAARHLQDYTEFCAVMRKCDIWDWLALAADPYAVLRPSMRRKRACVAVCGASLRRREHDLSARAPKRTPPSEAKRLNHVMRA